MKVKICKLCLQKGRHPYTNGTVCAKCMRAVADSVVWEWKEATLSVNYTNESGTLYTSNSIFYWPL